MTLPLKMLTGFVTAFVLGKAILAFAQINHTAVNAEDTRLAFRELKILQRMIEKEIRARYSPYPSDQLTPVSIIAQGGARPCAGLQIVQRPPGNTKLRMIQYETSCATGPDSCVVTKTVWPEIANVPKVNMQATGMQEPNPPVVISSRALRMNVVSFCAAVTNTTVSISSQMSYPSSIDSATSYIRTKSRILQYDIPLTAQNAGVELLSNEL